MAEANTPKPEASKAVRQRRHEIPTDPSDPLYATQLHRYLDQLLDEALEQTFPASDPTAVPTQRDIETK
jgi:hypothetical protein